MSISSASFEIRKSKLDCILFDGVNDSIDLGSDTALWSQGKTKFSFSLWILPTTNFDSTRDILRQDGTSNHRFALESTTGTNTLDFTIKDSLGVIKLATFNGTFNSNKWHFVVCVYDNSLGSENIKIYVDGVLGAIKGNLTETINLVGSLVLGGTTNDFKGNMKDFKWWTTTALSQTDVTNLYNNKEELVTAPDYWLPMDEGTGNPRDRISGSKVGTISGAVWTSISGLGGKIDTSASGLINLNAESNYWRDATGLETLNGSNLYRIFFIKFLGPGTIKQVSLALNQKPKSGYENFQWAFDPLQRNDYEYNKEPYKTFNGTTDNIQVPHSSSLSLLKHSLACWFRTTASGSVGYIIVKGNFASEVAGNNFNYSLLMTASNVLQYFWETSAGIDKFVNSPQVVNDGKWHMAVATYDQINLKLYIDGFLVGTLAETGTPDTNTMDVFIGAHGTGGLSNFWSGDIDEIRIWNDALTASEVLALYYFGTIPQPTKIVYENSLGNDVNRPSKVSQFLADEFTAPRGTLTWNSESNDIPDPPNIGDYQINQYIPVIGWWSNVAGSPDIENSLSQFNLYYALPSGQSGSSGAGDGSNYRYSPYGTMPAGVVTVADSASLDLTSAITVACWMRTTKDYTADLAGYLVVKGNYLTETAGQNINYALLVSTDVDPNNVAEFLFETSTGLNRYNVSGIRVNDGKWHFIVGTWDGQLSKIYVDGVLANTEDFNGDTPDNNNNSLIVGGHENFLTYVGDIDEVRIWNVTLTAQEIADLHTSGIAPRPSNIVYENTFGGSGTSGGSGDPQTPPSNSAFTFVMNADWGEENTTEDIVAQLKTFNPTLIVDSGDKAYASSPSAFLSIINGLQSKWRDSQGNHDSSSDYDDVFTTGKIFYQGTRKTYYYSIVQNAAFICMDTNISFSSGSAQYIAVNDFFTQIKNNPNIDWIFVFFHHPTFGAVSDHGYNEGNFVQTWMPIFDTNRVDIVFMGHNHNYERTYPVKYNSNSPTSPTVTQNAASSYVGENGTIYLRNGTGGHDTGSALYSLGSQKPFTKYQNDEDNGNVKGVFSSNNKVLTCNWITLNGETLDSFVITKT